MQYLSNREKHHLQSKTKHREVVGDFIVIEDNQEKIVTSNKDKAKLCVIFFKCIF